MLNSKEITDIIYDTLMENKQHKQLITDKVENPIVENKRGWITFDYEDITVHVNIFIWERLDEKRKP